MKIVFRLSCLGFGGAEQVFISIAKKLAMVTHAEIIFVVDRSKGENIETAENLGFSVISLNVQRNIFSITKLGYLLREIKPDVVFTAYTDTNAASIMSKVLFRGDYDLIVSEHSSLDEHWKEKSNFKKLLLNLYVKYLYPLADAVVCVSKGLELQVIEKIGRNRPLVKTIYNPVRFSNQEAAIRSKSNKKLQLLCVGRITAQKDYMTILKALPLIRIKVDCTLTVVGGIFSDAEKNKLDNFISDHELEESVVFKGYIRNVEEFYQSADIFVLCSAWEGFGNVIIEALSFGLPVVSTDCNHGPREILCGGKFGRLVPVGDENALAKAILDEWDCNLISKALLVKRAQDFSEENISSKYFDLINQVRKK